MTAASAQGRAAEAASDYVLWLETLRRGDVARVGGKNASLGELVRNLDALAAANLMLAAYAKGLGTCWIGFAQGWLGTEDGKRALGLPADVTPVAPIILGHPRQTPSPVPRKPPDIHWL